jgi:hypothetical protein
MLAGGAGYRTAASKCYHRPMTKQYTGAVQLHLLDLRRLYYRTIEISVISQPEIVATY